MATRTGHSLLLLSLALAACGRSSILTLETVGSPGASGAGGDPIGGFGGTGGGGQVGPAGQGEPGEQGGAAGQGGPEDPGVAGIGGAPLVASCTGLSVGGPVVTVSGSPSVNGETLTDVVAFNDRALVAWKYHDSGSPGGAGSAGSAGGASFRHVVRAVSGSGEALGPSKEIFKQWAFFKLDGTLLMSAGFGRLGALLWGGDQEQPTLLRLNSTGALIGSRVIEAETRGVLEMSATPEGFDFIGTRSISEGSSVLAVSDLVSIVEGGETTTMGTLGKVVLADRASLPDGSSVLATSSEDNISTSKLTLTLQRFAADGGIMGPVTTIINDPKFGSLSTWPLGTNFFKLLVVGDGLLAVWTPSNPVHPKLGQISVQAMTLDGVPKGPVFHLVGAPGKYIVGLDAIAVGDGALVSWVNNEKAIEKQNAYAHLVTAAGEPQGELLPVAGWRTVAGLRLLPTTTGALVVVPGNHKLYDPYHIEAVPLTCLP